MRSVANYFFFAAVVAVSALVFLSLSGKPGTRQERISNALHTYLEKHSTEMISALQDFDKEVAASAMKDPAAVAGVRQKFQQLRNAYKKIEPFSCYYFLASERNFNGPVVSEIEDESEEHPLVEYPHGLQVMASYLWSEQPESCREKLKAEIDLMHENMSALQIAFRTLPTDEVRFMEAIQLEVIRVFTLGISQFDSQESKSAIDETLTVLECLNEVVRDAYSDVSGQLPMQSLLTSLDFSIRFFRKTKSAAELDFLKCYREIYLPLSKSLAQVRTSFTESNYFPPSALMLGANSVFETDAFNRFFYNPRGTDPRFSSEAAALGMALFFDPVLSENNKRACASCHQPEKAFTDGMKTSNGFLEGEMLTRNAPTVINAALQRNYFFDMRADHLEGQIGHVLLNKKEMQSSFESAIQKLNTSEEYVAWFKRAFKGKEDTLISKTSIENAISEYERTLVSLDSKFDRNIRGDENSFTNDEKKGFNVFMSKGRCATCHYLPLFSGVVPPYYTRSEFEIIGTTSTADLKHPELDPDKGRGGLYGTEIFMHAFKTPSLRNIALTAPYMHNGAFENLKQVIDFYNKGGGNGLGLHLANQTLSPDSLHLSDKEINSLISF